MYVLLRTGTHRVMHNTRCFGIDTVAVQISLSGTDRLKKDEGCIMTTHPSWDCWRTYLRELRESADYSLHAHVETHRCVGQAVIPMHVDDSVDDQPGGVG
jgi:hypothetical protein